METKLLSIDGTLTQKQELPESVFSKKPDIHFLHEIVTYYLSNRRRGTASAKTKSEVRGGGRKPWKQKHTGRARHGSIRSPLWRKGGVVFGPRPRSWRQRMPARKRRIALCQALASKCGEESLVAVRELKLDEPKSKNIKAFLKNIEMPLQSRILFVDEKIDKNFAVAVRNFKNLSCSAVSALNAYDVLRADKVFLTPGAVKLLAGWLKEGYE